MRRRCTVRRLARAAASVVMGLAAAVATAAADAPAALATGPLATPPAEIAPGVHLFRGAFVPGRQPDGNSVVFATPAGLVVVDTGRHAAHTQRLLDFAAERQRPVAAIVNTHWHLDHIGGNAALRAAHPGAKLLASGAVVAARGGFLQRYRSQLEAMIADAATPAADRDGFRAELARIDGSARLDADVLLAPGSVPPAVAGRPLDLRVAAGATDADVWIVDPAHRLVVAGDLVTLPAPFLDTACATAWQRTLGEVAQVDFRQLVPGHGPVLDRAGFERYRAAFDQLLACAGNDARPATRCVDGWLADIGPLVDTADHGFTRELLGYYVDLLRQPERRACQ